MNEQMKHRIITISREYGSGGREIGQSLAARLGFSFYDKNVAELSAVQSGLSADFILKSEDDVPGSLSYRSYLAGNNIPLPDRIFMAQSDVIRRLAVQGPCVIVGRCADYVLRDFPRMLPFVCPRSAGRACQTGHAAERLYRGAGGGTHPHDRPEPGGIPRSLRAGTVGICLQLPIQHRQLRWHRAHSGHHPVYS